MSSEGRNEHYFNFMLQRIGSLGIQVDRLVNTVRPPTPAQTGSIWPKLIEDVLLIVVDEIAPPLDPRVLSSQTRDRKTLKLLRLVNSYFSCLVTPRLFDNISIGRTSSRTDIPSGILQHARFLSLYEHAFSVPTTIWLKMRSVEPLGIHLEASAKTPFWPFLQAHLLPFHPHIVHLSIRFSLLSFSGSDDLMDFKNAITILAKTVKSMVLDMRAHDFNGLSALKPIKQNFTELTSMKILGLDAFSTIWVFSENWVCSPVLETLHLSHSCFSFPDELSRFIRYMRNVTCVKVEDCRPFFCTTAKPNNANALYIERHRKLELIDKGTFFFGERKVKTRIELVLVEIDAFIDP
ncbi:hypothetical protein CPB86DRAFT_819938 [Serendipita vermifera]|nr:hypothetical protein CPB86DRAFT_819938 [Serendipita vermifera]